MIWDGFIVIFLGLCLIGAVFSFMFMIASFKEKEKVITPIVCFISFLLVTLSFILWLNHASKNRPVSQKEYKVQVYELDNGEKFKGFHYVHNGQTYVYNLTANTSTEIPDKAKCVMKIYSNVSCGIVFDKEIITVDLVKE